MVNLNMIMAKDEGGSPLVDDYTLSKTERFLRRFVLLMICQHDIDDDRYQFEIKQIYQLLTFSPEQTECYQNKASLEHQNLKIPMTTVMMTITMKTMVQIRSSQMY